MSSQTDATDAVDFGENIAMSDAQKEPITIQHRVRRMTGRDPGELHRVATPLELLFDLTFVIAFG